MTATSNPRTRRSSGAFSGARTLFTVRGVPVRLHASALLLVGLATWVLYGGGSSIAGFAALLGGPSAPALFAALATAVLLLGSLLIHELGHAFTSVDRSVPVVGITLFLLGGVTESTREPRSAKDEFVIVGIGPFLSLVLAAVFGLLHTAASPLPVVAAAVGYAAWWNLALAIFNVVPGYPLDGGRLLRSVLWAVVRNPHTATRWAARVGQLFALALMAFGLWAFLRSPGGFGGLWEVLIGFFLLRGALDAHRRARARGRFAGRRARDVMGSVPPTIAPGTSLAEAVALVEQRPSLLWPVGSPVTGALSLDLLDRVPHDRWSSTRAGDVAHPATAVTIDADESMDEALDRLADAPGNVLIVVADGHAVGLLTPSLVSDPGGR